MFFIYLMTIEDEEERKRIEDLYYKYRYHCLHLSKKYTDSGADAEDMVQEVFTRIIKHKDDYLKLSCSEFEALLVVMVKNLGIDEYRKRKRIVHITDENEELIVGRALPTETKVIIQEEFRHVIEYLRNYDEKTRLMMYYKSLQIPTRDIAEMLGMTFKTVETKIYRVRKDLKEKLKGDDFF